MDGLLEDPKTHETDPIPAEFPGVEFGVDLDEAVATPQEVAGGHASAAATGTNAVILHGTPLPFIGTVGTPASATDDDDKDEDDDIEEVDIPQNDPT